MKIARLLGATAVATVLAAPAMAQVVITQQQAVITLDPLALTGTAANLDLDSSNFAIVSVPGTSVSSIFTQNANNPLNTIGSINGNTVVPVQVANNSNFTIAQGAGAFTVVVPADPNAQPPIPGGNALISSDIDMNSINVISATSTSAGVSNALAAGIQSASNLANSAVISVYGASTGKISQQAGNLDIVSSNQMSAVVNNGNAVVGLPGVPGPTITSSQTATAGVNNATVVVGPSSDGGTPPVITNSTLDLVVKQQVLGNLDIQATNSALANSAASGSTVLDPVVQNLNQTSRIDVQTLGFMVSAPGATSQVNLTSDQITPSIPGVRNQFEIGNTAVGYTGQTTGTGYNFFSNASGNGIAEVKAVNQTTTFVQNSVNGGAGVSINLAGAANPLVGFQQTADGATTGINTPAFGPTIDTTTAPVDDFLTGGNYFPGIVNGMGARTYEGTANIAGGSQTFQNQQNYVGTGGTLSGSAVQTYSNLNSAMGNVALAEAVIGGSSISGLAQTNNQTYNTLGGGVLNGDFTQNASNMQALTGNAQVAVGSTTTSISGADQKSNFSINTFAAGTLNGGNIVQNAAATPDNAIGIVNVNVLATGGLSSPSSVSNASLQGSQLALSSVNTGTLGAAFNGAVTQTAGRIDITNVNSMNTNSGLNSSISGSQTSGSAINVIK